MHCEVIFFCLWVREEAKSTMYAYIQLLPCHFLEGYFLHIEIFDTLAKIKSTIDI